MSRNEEAPAGQGEGFEIDSCHPIPEESTNTSSIADTGTQGETRAEWNARDKAEKATWLTEHPEATAAKPDWADRVGVEWEFDEEHVTITYERGFGQVLLSRWASWSAGVVHFADGTTAPDAIVLLRDDPLTVAQMRELASNLLAAAPIVEQAQVTP
ncbi:hypothetical protein [Microbacterium oxydans]|uniref:hypothetical protein n=1 Tax=Microbacterium oxydans TaxID=82380 RepID=UPI000F8FA908|nr:hypothetical protein [Microbacterium oxydans]AZS48396.1 hypothetical protein CVS53_03116 [Microbacterium oxydans]